MFIEKLTYCGDIKCDLATKKKNRILIDVIDASDKIILIQFEKVYFGNDLATDITHSLMSVNII